MFIQVPDRNRIQSPEDQYADVHENIRLECDYGWAAKHSTLDERQRLFEGIDLRVSMLDEVRLQMVNYLGDSWMYPEQFENMKEGLRAWWGFLRDKPYEELDRRLFPARSSHGIGRLFGG
jgi:hypothetical protein